MKQTDRNNPVLVFGAFLFLKGQLKIYILDKNAVLKFKSSAVEAELFSTYSFKGYVDNYLALTRTCSWVSIRRLCDKKTKSQDVTFCHVMVSC